jgi:DNA-binding NtrC family response regulator
MEQLTNPRDQLDCESVIADDVAVLYLRRELTDGDRDAFEIHYLSCDRCAALVTDLEDVKRLPPATRPLVPRLRSQSAAMQSAYDIAQPIAASNMDLLICGETGVGKEFLAHVLHHNSPRANKPIVAITAAYQADLLDCFLFGDKSNGKPGLLREADGGTVLIDELTEMPASIQAKLVRIFQTREIPDDATRNVRFIATTSCDLQNEDTRALLRPDLMFWFSKSGIVFIPPLRTRREEIAEMALAFVAEACRTRNRPTLAIAPEAIARLQAFSWPANIRQLKLFMASAVFLCAGPTIELEHLPAHLGALSSDSSRHEATEASVPTIERQRLVEALEACSTNYTRAAKMLGIPRRSLIELLDKYSIARPQKTGQRSAPPTSRDGRQTEAPNAAKRK